MAARYPDASQPVDPIQVHINHFFDRVVDCVNHRRLTVLAEANDRRLKMTARVTIREQKERELLVMKADVEQKLTNNELREFQEKILVDIEAKLAEVRVPQPETHLEFRGEFEQLEQLILGLGEVLEEPVPAIPRYQHMEQIVAVGKEGQNPGELWSPHGVAIDEISNHIYVAEGGYGFARVSIFSERGEFLNWLTHEHMKHPWGVAFHRNNVYVTDIEVHGVFHFKMEAEIRFIAALVGRGSSGGMFISPGQLAVSDNGDLFIPDQYNHRIQILDESLHFQRSITHDSMHHPQDVQLTPDEMYVLSREDSPCVHIFSHAGDKLRSFLTRGQRMQVHKSWFFCLDAEKNLIISDGLDHCIKVFSPNGTLLHTIGTGGPFQTWVLLTPLGIALTQQLKLVVIARNNEFKLEIFSS